MLGVPANGWVGVARREGGSLSRRVATGLRGAVPSRATRASSIPCPPSGLWPSHGCQLLSVLQEPNKGVNPDEAVAYGAAVQVGLCLLGG